MAKNLNEPVIYDRIVGDREPIGWQLRDNDGVVVDVTAKTIVFRMVRVPTGQVIVNNSAATIVDATTGKVSYTFAANDVANAGTYALYFLDTTTTPNKRWPYDPKKRLLRLSLEA